MSLDIIVGTQWGDEGKGRLTDLLAAESDIVARFSGGDNAGHTVNVADQVFKLHLIPSGIVHEHTTCILGGGMVINPAKLAEEIDQLTPLGIDVSPSRLLISGAAHIITPAHIALDGAQEKSRGKASIGTTKRGIGPAYTDKAARRGIRASSMREPERFAELIREQVSQAGVLLTKMYGSEAPDADSAAVAYHAFAEKLRPHLADTASIISTALDQGKVVLAEGAQGTLLDLDHGTYPYVTSSHPIAPGAFVGLGIGATHVRRVIGVVKAFQTRVGEGPFPTELHDSIGEHLRGTGEQLWDEFGTTTGRPRRCGWLDIVLLRYAARLNGLTEIAVTKLDVLSGLNFLKICTAYQKDGQEYMDIPEDPSHLGDFNPIYEQLNGWESNLWQTRDWEQLPNEAMDYVRRIEKLTYLPIKTISVGPERSQVIHRMEEH
ncbi:MAG: adenylosuccinate synthase [Anaerolineales bacterium]|nr:adenylosuccinate synthase [Anaerolineales bacterium]